MRVGSQISAPGFLYLVDSFLLHYIGFERDYCVFRAMQTLNNTLILTRTRILHTLAPFNSDDAAAAAAC